MSALGKHGVTNERLDEVSDFYRYKPQDGGFGYTTPPQICVDGFPDLKLRAKLAFGTELKGNGRLVDVRVVN
ncbi:MAG: hypothetical protein CMO80_11910 [Verrucomicrobiales bacterium]|nr:hypothetical protein [Verrucomicrobiales bacterium]|tara:strand:+ start:2583 stop:2798 length:216 start_codon:yes stop_codon:yes gene_type:complete